MRSPRPVVGLAAPAIALCALVQSAAGAAPPGSLDQVLATVNGEPVTLRALRGEGGSAAPAGEARKVLDRMIGVELAIQEGYRMGLEETLEVRDQMGVFERDTLRDGLFAGRLRDLKPDPKQVERMAKDMAVEVRLRSAVFPSEADASRLAARAARGEDFDAAARELAADGKGKVDPGEGFIRLAELLPGVQDAIRSLEPGHVSAIYRIGDQFAVSRLIERRQAPTPDARAKAEAELLSRLQTEAIAKYLEELKRKHTRVDEAVYKGLDFDAAKPGFDTYLKDNRVLVSITGAEPIRVHDLADAVRKRLFHGPQRAAEKDRLNRKKAEVLEDLIAKRVVVLEARAKGLDRKPEYISRREEAERELVFGAFVSKVIEPEVKVTDAEVRQYYEAHRKELTAPDMVRVESIAFGSRKDAEAALAKLRAGADPAWMRSNAPGRLDPKTHQDLLDFPAAPLLLGDLPADLRQSLSSARSGEYRLHATAGGTTYVILLKELLPGRTLPLEDASGRIRAILMGQTRQKLFDGYIAKLRQASQVRILVTPAELEKLAATPPGK